MDSDTVIGLALIGVALCAILGLVLWSRRTIERIASRGFRSARRIERDLHRDR